MLCEGKVAIVTGGGRGLGAGYCRALSSEGASVVVADIAERNASGVADEVGGLVGRALVPLCATIYPREIRVAVFLVPLARLARLLDRNCEVILRVENQNRMIKRGACQSSIENARREV